MAIPALHRRYTLSCFSVVCFLNPFWGRGLEAKQCPDKLHSSGRECLVCSVFCWSGHPLFRKSGSTKTSKVVFLQFHSQKSCYLFTFYSSCWCVWVTSKIVRQVWSISVLSVCFVCLFVLGGVGTVWNFLLRGISAEFMKCDLFLVVMHNLCINGIKFF